MPCRDDYSAVDDSMERKKRLNRVTRLLCTQCKAIEAEGKQVHKDVLPWWETHKKQDEIRIKREQDIKRARDKKRLIKEIALSKLTIEEQRVLGLRT